MNAPRQTEEQLAQALIQAQRQLRQLEAEQAQLRAAELHGSGVTIYQAFRQMNWPFPKPETVQNTDFQRIDDRALSLMFTLMGPGFPDPKVLLTPINRE